MGRGRTRESGVLRARGSADELQFRRFVESIGGDAGEGDNGKHLQGGDGVWVHSDGEEAEGRQIPPAGGVQGADGASRQAAPPQFGPSPGLLPGQGRTPPRLRLLPQRQSLLPHSRYVPLAPQHPPPPPPFFVFLSLVISVSDIFHNIKFRYYFGSNV